MPPSGRGGLAAATVCAAGRQRGNRRRRRERRRLRCRPQGAAAWPPRPSAPPADNAGMEGRSLSAAFLVASAFLASAVEMVEALTIVLAVGLTRDWRPPLTGRPVPPPPPPAPV